MSAVLRRPYTIKGKDTRYKLYWPGNDSDTVGVGVFVAEEWIEKIFEVRSFQQNHSETYSWPPCGYHSVCECSTEWSSDGVKDLLSAGYCDCQELKI